MTKKVLILGIILSLLVLTAILMFLDSGNQTEILPVVGPVLLSIPSQEIYEGSEFPPLYLSRYIGNGDSLSLELFWMVRGAKTLSASIDDLGRLWVKPPNPDWFGTDSIWICVTDSTGLQDSVRVFYYVHPVNDAPQVSVIPDQMIEEGASFKSLLLKNFVFDPDDKSGDLRWKVSGQRNLSVQLAPDGLLQVAPPDGDWFGAETLKIRVIDHQGAMAERKVCYKLLPVNDPPQLASIPVQVIEEGSNFADLSLKDYCKDVDDPFENLSWDVFGVQKLRVIVSPDGILSAIVPDSNWFGSERIRLTVTDPQSRSAATEICYQVLPVNDPPLFSAIPKQEIREGRAFPPLNLALYTNDVDNPARELTWELQKIHYLEARLKDRHWLYIRPPGPHWYGTDTLWIAVSDPAGAGSITQIPYRVTDVNTVREFKHSPLSGVKRMAQIGGGDLLALSSYPLRWQSEQFSVFMAVILSTATLTLVDDYIQEIAVRDRSLVGSALYQFGDFYGKSLASEITAVSLGLYGLAFNHEKALRMGLEVYESYLISNTLTSMLKRYLGRSRPNNNNGPYIFDPSESRYEDYRALPSGHTTLAFSLSTVLALHMENPFFKALCFTPALVTALQRIYGNYHWTSDVFLGATIGYVIGQYIVRRHDRILNHWIQLGFNPDGSFGLNLRL